MNTAVAQYRVPAPPRLLLVRKSHAASWQDVHRRLVELGRRRAAHERELCCWLLEAERLQVPRRLGYASIREYAERTLGLSARQTEERLRAGRALADLPELDRALQSGDLCWSVTRELTRIATGDNERTWIAWVRGRRAQDVERAVAERRAGDRPESPGDPNRVRHRLAFDVRAETIALFRDLEARVKQDLGEAGAPVDDDTLLFEIARRALAGPDDAGRAHYQIAVSRCDTCRTMSLDAGGRTHVLDQNVADMIACDAQQIGRVDSHGSVDSPSPHLGAAVANDRSQRPHLGATPARATQTIPPATRRVVLRRHHGRCAVPGCRHHRFLDLHHTHERARGGTHDPEHLVALCGAHHRALHRGNLVVSGNATQGFVFHHPDGGPYGQPLDAPRLDLAQQALTALTAMGFSTKQARARIEAAQRRGASGDIRMLLRAALRASA